MQKQNYSSQEKVIENYKEYKKVLLALVNMTDDIINGTNITVACQKHGINYRNFLHMRKYDILEPETLNEDITISDFGCLSYHEKFLRDLFHKDVIPMPDFEEVYQEVTKVLDEKSKNILTRYYLHGETLEEIGQFYNLSRERIRQIIAKSMNILRRPKRANAFLYGLDFLKQDKELDNQIQEAYKLLDEKRFELQTIQNDIQLLEENKKCAILNLKENTIIENNIDDNIKILRTPIEDLNFSARTYHYLYRANIRTVKDILFLSNIGLKRIRNIGQKSRSEIISKMHDLGFTDYQNK